MGERTEEYTSRETGSRVLTGMAGHAIPVVAACWSLFQLALPKILLLPSELVRCIHLSFALILVYLSFPALRSRRLIGKLSAEKRRLAFLYRTDRIPVIDGVLAVVAAGVALYLALDYAGIASRIGSPLARDLVVGIVLIGLLLEAARRALGPALPTIALLFILYSFFSETMPDLIASKNASLSKVITKLTLTTEGIYGVPLDVSANMVFLFVLFGAMLEKAGGGQYFIEVAYSLLGRFKGGPAKAAVLASGLTGMVNGSSIANTVCTGTFTIPLMKRMGFPGIKAGAVEVAASTNGQLMPPIMGAAAFIIAEYCNMPYLEVVRAAFVPAVCSYITLIYITHLEAGKLGLKGQPAEELPRFRDVFPRGLHFLIPLAFLLYLLIVRRTSAAYSAFYAIVALAALMVTRNLFDCLREKQSLLSGLTRSVRELWASLVAGGRNMMSIGVAVAAAGIIVGIVTLGLGNVITEVIDVLSGGNIWLMLLITAFVSLILGMGLPTTANYIVMASLTAPAILLLAENAGYAVPVIAAHLFVFYFGILSDDTPPVGLSAYAAAAISGDDPIRTGIQGFKYDIRTAILPFMFFFNTELLLIGVDSWWQIVVIFITALVALFAFAALTQNYLTRKNRFEESIALAAVTLILFRPGLFQEWIGGGRSLWYVVGIALFAAVFGAQRLRKA
jgi:TRAP transporter 4TM/12TM fusion protein